MWQIVVVVLEFIKVRRVPVYLNAKRDITVCDCNFHSHKKCLKLDFEVLFIFPQVVADCRGSWKIATPRLILTMIGQSRIDWQAASY